MSNLNTKIDNFFSHLIEDLEKDIENNIDIYFDYKKKFEESSYKVKTIGKFLGHLDDSKECVENLTIQKKAQKEMLSLQDLIILKYRLRNKYIDDLRDI